MVCPTCYQDYISKCSNTLTINAQLDPDTDFVWLIRDKFGNEYGGNVTTDGDGLATIDITSDDLPAGLLTPHSGYFTIYLFGFGTDDEISFTIGSTSYGCIEFNVKDGTHAKTYLGEYTDEPVSS